MEHVATPSWAMFAYLVSGVLFILALRGLSSPATSRSGNRYGMIGMVIAVVTTLVTHFPTAVNPYSEAPAAIEHGLQTVPDFGSFGLIAAAIALGGGIGFVIARRIAMTAMPQLVAAFHSLVGMAAVLVGWAAYLNPQAFGIAELANLVLSVDFGNASATDPVRAQLAQAMGGSSVTIPGVAHIAAQSCIEMGLGIAIGAITFSGSIIAFLKLAGKMSGSPIMLPGRHVINLGTIIAILGLVGYFTMDQSLWVIGVITLLSFIIGFLLIIPIGGADMPVVVSMLNSYSGWAAAAMGFTLHNSAMIITGALVGSSGAILSYIMCKAMNRSFISVIAGGFGAAPEASGGAPKEQRPWKRGSAEDAAFLMKEAESVIIIPGYGMAVSQAQHALREMADVLKKEGVSVKYAIHPVAGRMPGHMNVLLAEANVPYDEVFELEDINSEFGQCDVAFIIGANDVVNPAAKTDKSSPIYGMPVFDVDKAKTVMFVKRSMGGVGYSGVDNDVFYMDQTMMLLADAKKMVEDIVKALAH
ncbi:NAD(P) transhydrogenase subunit beta [Novosphingobium sp. SG751A]|uniref:NAD(P)(+) transhydrogenase (Re/Si-specific) subunit beta n=1 Tax=Novosphingobium sp. SG751A TaxID=2587000 RepID=UPI0015556466|nr:NAD(P)(+) transhydrogenase (Re/Si-specific) subunit beta [Novosphingobium sp. SG751A]NOW43953.1 NAD(P) transhydrogenase subunit beta [Novosphingobium sp. SG751A]